MLAFSKLFDALSEDQISSCEKRMGITLPSEYKAFLRLHNGGRPTPNQAVIPKINEPVLVDILYGIASTRQPADIDTEFQEIREAVGEGFLPIGHDPGGNYFLLAISGGVVESIYYWDACRAFAASNETENTYFVAKGIEELLSSLK